MKKYFSTLIVFCFIFNGLLPVCSEGADYSKVEEESRIGNLFDFYMTETFVMLKDNKMTEKIAEVVERIAKVSDNPDIHYRVRVINDPLPIVSSFPGSIYVSSGMLDILGNEDDLASVIAHAIAHVIEKDPYDTYLTVLRKNKLARLTGHLMPLLVFAGVGGAAIAGGGMAAASAHAVENILLLESGIYAMSSIVQVLTFNNLPGEKIALNRMGPYLYFPDTKPNLSAFVFFGEIYGGYKKDEEIKADNLAINYLYRAGYDTEALVSVLKKLLEIRSEYVAKNHIYHLLIARPGLEKRIENAIQTIKKHK